MQDGTARLIFEKDGNISIELKEFSTLQRIVVKNPAPGPPEVGKIQRLMLALREVVPIVCSQVMAERVDGGREATDVANRWIEDKKISIQDLEFKTEGAFSADLTSQDLRQLQLAIEKH